jgi:hypothetical protein
MKAIRYAFGDRSNALIPQILVQSLYLEYYQLYIAALPREASLELRQDQSMSGFSLLQSVRYRHSTILAKSRFSLSYRSIRPTFLPKNKRRFLALF